MTLERSIPYRWRIEKAEGFLKAARDAFEQGHWETCVSRAYYAVYHLVAIVLAEKANVYRDRWDHRPLHNAFLDRFCKRGFCFNRQDGEDFFRLMQDRFDADYHDVIFNQRRTERSLGRAEALYNKILEVITNG